MAPQSQVTMALQSQGRTVSPFLASMAPRLLATVERPGQAKVGVPKPVKMAGSALTMTRTGSQGTESQRLMVSKLSQTSSTFSM